MRRLVAILLLVLAPAPARAGGNDLHLARLLDPGQVTYDMATGNVLGVQRSIAAESRYRTLMSELGAGLALRVLDGADTLGLSGFNFSLDVSTMGVGSAGGDDPWRAAEKRPGGLSTVGLFLRKGLWVPAPAFELGVGTIHLLDSDTWALQAYAKLALLEGFHRWPIPSLALRAGGSRLVGAQDLDLTVANLDILASKAFGIGGTVTLVPYLGWTLLWIVPRGQVLDATPWCDALAPGPSDAEHLCPSVRGGDLGANFTFRDQSVITRNRLSLGAKLKFYVAALTAEYSYTLAGSSKDTGDAQVVDRASGQSAFSLSLATQF